MHPTQRWQHLRCALAPRLASFDRPRSPSPFFATVFDLLRRSAASERPTLTHVRRRSLGRRCSGMRSRSETLIERIRGGEPRVLRPLWDTSLGGRLLVTFFSARRSARTRPDQRGTLFSSDIPPHNAPAPWPQQKTFSSWANNWCQRHHSRHSRDLPL